MSAPFNTTCIRCGAPGHFAPESPVKDYICPRCLPRWRVPGLLLALLLTSCGSVQVDRREAKAVLRAVCETVEPSPEDPLIFRLAWALACTTVK